MGQGQHGFLTPGQGIEPGVQDKGWSDPPALRRQVRSRERGGHDGPGLVNNTILFCLRFVIKIKNIHN